MGVKTRVSGRGGSVLAGRQFRASVRALPVASARSLPLLLLPFLLMSFGHFSPASAQQAGVSTLPVLDVSPFARTAGLGLDYLPLYADDPVVGLDNPSLLHEGMAGCGVVSLVPMFDGSHMGAVGYVHHSERLGTLSFGLRYANYGTFQLRDEEDMPQGRFTAGDYALTVGWGMWVDSNFSVGASFSPILSQYESYTAVAVAFDVAGSYVNDARTLAATVMMRNVGAQIVTFDRTSERLSFELSAELSYKLKRAPFRLYLAAIELQRWNLRYEDPLSPTVHTDPFTGEVTRQNRFVGLVDNLLRHAQVGVELTLGRSLFARVGYSYRQSAEMRGFDVLNLSGFSFGLGVRTRRFEFAFARHNYHVTQAPNYFTISYRF